MVGRVSALAISPDGAWVASADEDGTLWVWEASKGLLLNTFSSGADRISVLAISPDGRKLAAADGDGKTWIWDIRTWREIARLDLEGSVLALAINPHAWELAWTGRDGIVRIRGVPKRYPQRALTGLKGPVLALAISPDGRRLAAGGGDGTVSVWEMSTGSVKATFTQQAGPVLALAISPDGRRLAAGGGDGTVSVWEMSTGSVKATFTQQAGPVLALAISPDGAKLASADADGMLRISVSQVEGSNPQDEIHVYIYVDTNDASKIRRIADLTDELIDMLGFNGPLNVEINRGSWIRKSTARIKRGLTSSEVKARLTHLEQAAELYAIDDKQAQVDAKFASTVSLLIRVPQGCAKRLRQGGIDLDNKI